MRGGGGHAAWRGWSILLQRTGSVRWEAAAAVAAVAAAAAAAAAASRMVSEQRQGTAKRQGQAGTSGVMLATRERRPMPEWRHGSAVAVPPRATSLVVDLIPCRNLASWNGAWVGLWVIHRQRLSVASRLWWAGAEHSLVLGAACVTSQRRTAATRVTWGWAGVGLMWITFSAGLPQCGCSGLPLSAGECLGTRLAGTCSARLVHRGCCENGLARWFVRVCHVHAQFPWTIEARSLLTVTMFADDDDEYYDANDDNG